jgi:hypothetical protein
MMYNLIGIINKNLKLHCQSNQKDNNRNILCRSSEERDIVNLGTVSDKMKIS